MSYQIGDRVGAILSADEHEVRLLGYGTYQGEEIPSETAGGLGPLIRQAGCTNPKIVLDSGRTVWGCECWWGSENQIIAGIGNRRVVIVEPAAPDAKTDGR